MDGIVSSRRSSILLGERHTSIFNRFMAKGIDLIVIAALYFILGAVWLPLGIIVSAVFASLQDSLGVGQSIGKRIIGLRVIEDHTGMGCSAYHSILRNAPISVWILTSHIPVLWAFVAFVVTALSLLEIYLLLTIDVGVRLGDVMGNTLVVEHFEEQHIAMR